MKLLLILASVLILSLIGIIGVQESFGEPFEFEWYVGKHLEEKNYFKYKLCHIEYNNCQPFDMHLWAKPRFNSTDMWIFETMVVHDNHKIRGTITMDQSNTSSIIVSDRINQFGKIFGKFISNSNYYVKDLKNKEKLEPSIINNTYILLMNTNSVNKNGFILISEELPFPSQGNETYKESVYSKQGKRGEKIFEIDLITAKTDHIPDFLMYDSSIDKNSILSHTTRVLKLPNNTNTIQLPKPLTTLVNGIWIYVSPGATNVNLEFNSNTPSSSGGWGSPISSGAKPLGIYFPEKLPISNMQLTYDNVCCDAYVHIGYYYQDVDIKSNDLPDDYLDPIINSLRPLHQIKAGVKSTDIFCKPWLSLVFKSNNFPACVTPETAEKLIQRGWEKLQ